MKERQVQHSTHIAERDIPVRKDKALISWLAAQCVLPCSQQRTRCGALPDGIVG